MTSNKLWYPTVYDDRDNNCSRSDVLANHINSNIKVDNDVNSKIDTKDMNTQDWTVIYPTMIYKFKRAIIKDIGEPRKDKNGKQLYKSGPHPNAISLIDKVATFPQIWMLWTQLIMMKQM